MAGKVRILGIVFEIPAAQGVALYVERWAEKQVAAVRKHLVRDAGTDLAGDFVIPGGSHHSCHRKTGAIVAFVRITGSQGVHTQTRGAVIHSCRNDPETLERMRAAGGTDDIRRDTAFPQADQHMGLLLQGHPGNDGINSFFCTTIVLRCIRLANQKGA